MPMLDAYIPAGALTADAEHELLSKLTTILLKWEGADPDDPRYEAAKSIAWVFLHRPEAVLVGGVPPTEPRYKVVVSVPEGQFDDDRRAGMVAAITAEVLRAEGATRHRDALRVWVFTREVPDGTWGGGGRIQRLADIAGFVLGDTDAGRAHAADRLAARPA